jgi:hypothetical protein
MTHHPLQSDGDDQNLVIAAVLHHTFIYSKSFVLRGALHFALHAVTDMYMCAKIHVR